eukprot:12070293-Alexandrium_andersonii.AAC.1
METTYGGDAARIHDLFDGTGVEAALSTAEAGADATAASCSATEDDEVGDTPIPTADNPHAMMGPAEMQ